ncbi:hypothetical protein K438DRAFT_2022964 [Mycena galopus ATCC 62051]|nr:hypothetical protein K438DRAFT_2022964 [Mycena galopus ATCC 62051]
MPIARTLVAHAKPPHTRAPTALLAHPPQQPTCSSHTHALCRHAHLRRRAPLLSSRALALAPAPVARKLVAYANPSCTHILLAQACRVRQPVLHAPTPRAWPSRTQHARARAPPRPSHGHSSSTRTPSQTPLVAYVKAAHARLIAPANASHPVAHATSLRPCPPMSVAWEFVVHAHSRPSQAHIVSHEPGASALSSPSERELLAPIPSHLHFISSLITCPRFPSQRLQVFVVDSYGPFASVLISSLINELPNPWHIYLCSSSSVPNSTSDPRPTTIFYAS